jgi:uncharacterized membrane protein
MLRHIDELLYDLIGLILKLALLALAALFISEFASWAIKGEFEPLVSAFLGLTFGSILARFGFRLP